MIITALNNALRSITEWIHGEYVTALLDLGIAGSVAEAYKIQAAVKRVGGDFDNTLVGFSNLSKKRMALTLGDLYPVFLERLPEPHTQSEFVAAFVETVEARRL